MSLSFIKQCLCFAVAYLSFRVYIWCLPSSTTLRIVECRSRYRANSRIMRSCLGNSRSLFGVFNDLQYKSTAWPSEASFLLRCLQPRDTLKRMTGNVSAKSCWLVTFLLVRSFIFVGSLLVLRTISEFRSALEMAQHRRFHQGTRMRVFPEWPLTVACVSRTFHFVVSISSVLPSFRYLIMDLMAAGMVNSRQQRTVSRIDEAALPLHAHVSTLKLKLSALDGWKRENSQHKYGVFCTWSHEHVASGTGVAVIVS